MNHLPPTPTPNGHLAKRHYYTCGSETLSWSQEWYTEGFYTSSKSYYDSAASTGPVDPPSSVSACADVLSSDSVSASATVPNGQSALSASGTSETVFTTSHTSVYTSAGQTASTIVREVTTATLAPSTAVSQTSTSWSSPFASGSTAAASSSNSLLTSANSLSSLIPTSKTSFLSSSTISASATNIPLAGAVDPMAINMCAGGWDWQNWGVVAGLGAGAIIGGVLWLLWAILRDRMPGLYAPRTWSVLPDSRPSAKWSIATFLLPFLHIPSPESSATGGSTFHFLYTGLKLAAITSLLALSAVLPLTIADVPCLSKTAPTNNLRGRLGSLTDLSLLRLMDALDPSPDSPAATTTIRLLVQNGIKHRALPSTIAPAISSAKIRLIIILVILAVLAVGGGLFVIARTYAALAHAKKNFEQTTCGGMDMISVSSIDARGWRGMSEEAIKRSLNLSSDEKEEERETNVIGVFAVPDMTALTAKAKEREETLMRLEIAEANYINSFHLMRTGSSVDRSEPAWWANDNRPNQVHTYDSTHGIGSRQADFVAPAASNKITPIAQSGSSDRQHDLLPPSLSSSAAAPVYETRFHEINRDSAMFGPRFELGQRIKIDEHGHYVPDPSPESESGHPLGSGSVNSHSGEGRPSNVESAVEAASEHRESPASPAPNTGEAVRGTPAILSTSQSTDVLPHLLPGPARRPELHVIPSTESIPHSRNAPEAPEALARFYADIREHRTHFKELNAEIEGLQNRTFADIVFGKGDNIKGWILVGRGARWLPFAQVIKGVTKEDILWNNAGVDSKGDERKFWIKVIILGLILALIMIPFLGLVMGTAPGFAHYLGLLKPLANNDGFGSGVVEGLVPAVAATLAIGIAIYAIERFAKGVRCISKTHQKILAFKATFWLLLSVIVVWVIIVSALEFAVQGFATDVQKARSVGDGAIYSTWFILIFLINLACILPALYLLQPKRLVTYMWRRRRAVTPRQKFRLTQPPSYTPSYALTPCLLAVFYASTLLFLFPLLAIPLLVLLYLSFVANRYMAEYVFIDHSNAMEIDIALWSIRRLGWILPFQPALYGLILLSRDEWTLGGISIGVAGIAVILSELLTVGRYRRPNRRDLSIRTRRALDNLSNVMSNDSTKYATTNQSGLEGERERLDNLIYHS